jgi:hypothetical protein
MTPEEREKKYEELRRRANGLSKNKAEHRNPDMVVRWVHIGNQDQSYHVGLGFKVVQENPKTPLERRKVDTMIPISEDGMYRNGDVILMEIDRATYEFYLEENARLSRLQINSGKENFKDAARRQRVPSFDRDEFFDPRTNQFHRQ